MRVDISGIYTGYTERRSSGMGGGEIFPDSSSFFLAGQRIKLT